MEKVLDYYARLNKVPVSYKELPLSDVATLRDYNSKVGWVIIQDGRHNWPAFEFSKINVASVIIVFFDAL